MNQKKNVARLYVINVWAQSLKRLPPIPPVGGSSISEMRHDGKDPALMSKITTLPSLDAVHTWGSGSKHRVSLLFFTGFLLVVYWFFIGFLLVFYWFKISCCVLDSCC